MCGRATLAMLVSSTSMNVASITVKAIHHGLMVGRRHPAGEFGLGEAVHTRALRLRRRRAKVTSLRGVLKVSRSERGKNRCSREVTQRVYGRRKSAVWRRSQTQRSY